MNGIQGDLEQEEWRSATGRARKLWKGAVGGTYDTLALELASVAGSTVHSPSLAQSLRPKGRKPRNSADLLAGLAKVLATKLEAHRPDLSPEEFERAIKEHIVAGAASPLGQPAIQRGASRSSAIASALFTIDLWTPGQSGQAIIKEFAPALGPEGADLIRELADKAVEAIGRGDFAGQRAIADEAIRIGQAAPSTPLRGEGLYLKGEALRLMADFEPDRGQARRLRREAEELYGQAEEVLRGDPRPIRGRARTMEVLGDLDGALEIFSSSHAAIEARGIKPGQGDYLSLAHERVRTLRHKINCLAAMHQESPLATAEASKRGEEIRRLILASEPQHKDALKLFENHRDWWLIEWFMAQVLHARAWVSINELGWASKRLEWSLKLRLDMLPEQGSLSPVELGNLHWWLGVARDAREGFEPEQCAAFDALKAALARGADRPAIKKIGQRFLTAGAAPWLIENL